MSASLDLEIAQCGLSTNSVGSGDEFTVEATIGNNDPDDGASVTVSFLWGGEAFLIQHNINVFPADVTTITESFVPDNVSELSDVDDSRPISVRIEDTGQERQCGTLNVSTSGGGGGGTTPTVEVTECSVNPSSVTNQDSFTVSATIGNNHPDDPVTVNAEWSWGGNQFLVIENIQIFPTDIETVEQTLTPTAVDAISGGSGDVTLTIPGHIENLSCGNLEVSVDTGDACALLGNPDRTELLDQYGSLLREYASLNGDPSIIDTSDLIVALDDWESGSITDNEVYAVICAWDNAYNVDQQVENESKVRILDGNYGVSSDSSNEIIIEYTIRNTVTAGNGETISSEVEHTVDGQVVETETVTTQPDEQIHRDLTVQVSVPTEEQRQFTVCSETR